uniref:Integrin alpha-2 domain-containing protein n=1 Tax=Electrophorus electricus TaxID=8005 RepID=A0A4W4EJ21_ELEEL
MDLQKSSNFNWRVNMLKWLLGCACCLLSLGYNLDVQHSLNFNGPNGSLFGYSVLVHKHQKTPLVVGAPEASSSFYPSVIKPGGIYKCSISTRNCEALQTGGSSLQHCGKTCLAEGDNQWLGVSLSRRASNGDILACGHRWKNVFFARKDNQNKLPYGVCFKISSGFSHTTQYIPCYRDHQRKFGEDYGSCQAGISNVLTEDLMIMGAPGSFYWTGTVLVYNVSSNVVAAYVDDDSTVLYGSYLGYSVGAGHFLHRDSMEIVGGAPQHGQAGKVYIFQVEGKTLKIVNETSGSQLGSYYGASVCAVDLNADGLSDLLVGAPMYSVVREEGRVHVYINQGQVMSEAPFKLVGRDSYAARFGETITDLGDIDNDGYPDVAIGAPQEEDLRGAVYIYNGRKGGVTASFSQRITGSVLGNSLRMFGQSVSGGVDVDGNGYPDVAVGAYLSDSVIVLRTRPVVMVEASLLLPASVNRSVALCHEHGLPAVCVEVSVCFRVKGKQVPGHIEVKFNLTADVHNKEPFPSRFYFHGNGTSNVTAGRVRAKHGEETCSMHQAFLRRDVRDIFTPVHFEVEYELGEHRVARAGPKISRPLTPILQQREGFSNLVSNKTQFARYCVWENCSTNLQISAHLVLPQSHNNVPYFALGNGKTIMLNATLANIGDDAFLPKLLLRFPTNLHFIRVLDAEEKYVSCEVVEENKTHVGLDCSVGNLYIPSLSKLNISFLLDVNQNSSAGDLSISINVMNTGPSRALDTKVQIEIPHVLTPYPDRLIQIRDLQTTLGRCHVKNGTLPMKDVCDVPKASVLQELVFFVSKSSRRRMFCVPADDACATVECSFGNMDVGKEATVNLEVELNPDVLQMYPVSSVCVLCVCVCVSECVCVCVCVLLDMLFLLLCREFENDNNTDDISLVHSKISPLSEIYKLKKNSKRYCD